MAGAGQRGQRGWHQAGRNDEPRRDHRMPDAWWSDGGDGPEERSRSRRPREPRSTWSWPPEEIKIEHRRGSGCGLFVTNHRRDVVNIPLASLCNAVPDFKIDQGHITFVDDVGPPMRLGDLPSGLNTIRDIERHHWKWVAEICFSRW